LFISSKSYSKGSWTQFYSNDGGDYYLDEKRLKKRGNKVYVWTLSDYLEPINSIFFSTIEYQTNNCENKKFKDLKIIQCEKSMGNGKCRDDSYVLSGSNFTDRIIIPDGYYSTLVNKVCR
jgi:hypothetical protein